jgi:hypothetical protein
MKSLKIQDPLGLTYKYFMSPRTNTLWYFVAPKEKSFIKLTPNTPFFFTAFSTGKSKKSKREKLISRKSKQFRGKSLKDTGVLWHKVTLSTCHFVSLTFCQLDI